VRRLLVVAALVLAAAAAPAGAAPPSIQAQLFPQDPQFGDTVVATVEVAVPAGVDPSTVRIHAEFGPYEVLSRSRSTTAAGIAVTSRLRCLDLPCVPREQVKSFRFKPVRISYGRTSETRSWPPLRVHSRVTKADDAAPVLRIPAPAAAPDAYRVSPNALGYGLLVLGGLLAVGGAALLLAVGLRRTSPRRRVAPLDQVLAELAASCTNGDSGRRRRALEDLARELEPLDESLSAESRVLAWGPDEPRAEAISELTSRVRTEVRT
jgi:hypothetical protein